MSEKLKLKAGAKVPFREKLFEGYEITDTNMIKMIIRNG